MLFDKYWSFPHLAYMWDQRYGSGRAGYCSKVGNNAATQHMLNPSSITLCPISFGSASTAYTSGNLQTSHYVQRRAVTPVPRTRADIVAERVSRNSDQSLTDVMPPGSAATLFHELFHLVLGNDVTDPTGGEIYGLFSPGGLVGLDYQQAVANPESYTAVAVAYDYTLSWDTGSDAKIEFYAGFTSQG